MLLSGGRGSWGESSWAGGAIEGSVVNGEGLMEVRRRSGGCASMHKGEREGETTSSPDVAYYSSSSGHSLRVRNALEIRAVSNLPS